MIHTSIRLSEEHANRIKETGKSPTVIIKDALDAYFKMSSRSEVGDNRSARDLIAEHVRLYHKHSAHTSEHDISEPIEHKVSTIEHRQRIQGAHMVRTGPKAIIAYILEEISQGREPMLPDVAVRFNTTTQTLSKTLSPYGIRAQETKRGGNPGRYFILAMRGQLEEILSKS